jgi:hypothetical protein
MAQQPTTQLQAKANLNRVRLKKLTSELHSKRRGNPHWGSGTSLPFQPTVSEFDRTVERLRLQPHEYIGSGELREWVEANKDSRFVPERLLKAWGLSLRGSIDDIG